MVSDIGAGLLVIVRATAPRGTPGAHTQTRRRITGRRSRHSRHASGRQRRAITTLLSVVLLFLVSGCSGLPCSLPEREIFGNLNHIGSAPTPNTNFDSGACFANWMVEATAEEVFDHYEKQLSSGGWQIEARELVESSDLGGLPFIYGELLAHQNALRVQIHVEGGEAVEGGTNVAIHIDDST